MIAVDARHNSHSHVCSPRQSFQFTINLYYYIVKKPDANLSEEFFGQETVKKHIDEEFRAQEHEISFEGMRALLVEDNMINMEIAKMLLEQAGFLIETAENGKIALEMTEASAPGYYDVILMDIQMPVMDGYTAVQAIRSLPDVRLAGIPIIAMTANAFQEDIKKAEEVGMNGHIAKPLDIPQMKATLQLVLKSTRK